MQGDCTSLDPDKEERMKDMEKVIQETVIKQPQRELACRQMNCIVAPLHKAIAAALKDAGYVHKGEVGQEILRGENDLWDKKGAKP